MTIEQIKNFKQVTPNIASSGQPDAEQLCCIAQEGYQTILNLGMPDHAEALADEQQHVTRLSMQYVALPIPFNAPTQQHFHQFAEVMRHVESQGVWVHCILNYRVSSFLFLYLQTQHHYTPAQARHAVFTDWQANPVWQAVWHWTLSDNS